MNQFIGAAELIDKRCGLLMNPCAARQRLPPRSASGNLMPQIFTNQFCQFSNDNVATLFPVLAASETRVESMFLAFVMPRTLQKINERQLRVRSAPRTRALQCARWGDTNQAGESHMTRKLFIATAAAAIVAVSGAAWAQNANNPAPAYPSSASATPETDAAPIVNPNNPAPAYPSAASATPRTDAAPIVNANNPAPMYPAATAPAKQTRHAGKKSSRAIAHSRHHTRPARNG